MFTDRGDRLYPITADVFDAMAEAGMFEDDERIELLDGAIVAMSNESPLHIYLAGDVMGWAVKGADLERLFVGAGAPLRMGPLSQPEPDIYVLDRSALSLARRPTRAHLAIEVSITSLSKDLDRKAEIYAAGGVPDYWVIDPAHRVVHVHRDPEGDRYRSITQVEPPTLLEPANVELPPLDLGWLFSERFPDW